MHLNDHGAAIDSPQIKSFLQLASVEFDQSDFEVLVHFDALSDCSMFPLLEILGDLATEKCHESLRGSLAFREKPLLLNRY